LFVRGTLLCVQRNRIQSDAKQSQTKGGVVPTGNSYYGGVHVRDVSDWLVFMQTVLSEAFKAPHEEASKSRALLCIQNYEFESSFRVKVVMHELTNSLTARPRDMNLARTGEEPSRDSVTSKQVS
jgi:hypothetical protein